MNLSPESRSRPHNLLLVGLTEGKPKDLPRLLDLFSDLQDFMVGDQLWRPIICFVSADLPALAECAGVQGHCAMFGCVRCYMAATRMGSRLCYVGHNRFFPESDARHNNSSGERPRERSLALAQVDLSIQSPHRGTVGISPLLHLTPRQSFRDFTFDAMHAIKNILAALFAALGGQVMKPPRLPSRNSPDEAAEYAERHAAWTEDARRAEYWRLTEAKKSEFDRRYNSIPAPTTVRRNGLAPMAKPSQMLCSDWLHLLFFMRYNLCGIAKADVFQLIVDLCDLLSALVCGNMERSELPGLYTDTIAILVRMEALCPSSCLSPTLHVLCHVWDDLDWFGSVQGTWCFPWERWMRFIRAHIKSAAYPIRNYLNQHLLGSRLPLLSDARKFEVELLFEQLNYIPSELLGDVLGREANSTNCFLGKVAADDIPLIPLDEVRNCIAQSCPVVQRLLSRGKRAYDVYTCRLRARDQNPITFEQWLGYGNLRGSPWTR